MFIFESYLLRPNFKIRNLDDLNKNPENYYISVDDKESIVAIKDQFDTDYFEGVIYIKFNDIVIMDYRYWDVVDSLWAYLLNLMIEFNEKGDAEVYFPDQPILIKLSSINKDLVLFSIKNFEDKKLSLPKRDFFNAILDNGESFFESMQEYFGSYRDYNYQLEKINKLRKLVG
ncbi:MAG: hypothetical protein JEZ00_17235 [Anaerolineaceae bacterium]|nr:hypothetical protein [Anaerolineaceae bacterium]